MPAGEEFDPTDLDIAKIEGLYVLAITDRQVMTSIGMHPVAHAAPDLLEHIISEFMSYNSLTVNAAGQIEDPTFIGAYRFLGLQREWVEPGQDTFTRDLAHALAPAPMFLPLAGPESVDQYARWTPVNEWLTELGVQRFFGGYVSFGGCEAPYGSDADHEAAHLAMAAVLEGVFAQLDPEQQAVAVYLSNAYDNAVVHSLALVCDACTPREFAIGVLAANHILPVFRDLTDADLPAAAQELTTAATAGLNYIDYYRRGTAAQRLLEALKSKRESGSVEFKSTLRWNLREGKKDRTMTDVVVKTIAGFLNTDGGTLVIGVDDDGRPVGIEIDAFDSDDKFLRHLYTALTNAMGPQVTPLVAVDLVPHSGKTIALVEVTRGNTPVSVTNASGNTLFYVRTGPATIALSDEQITQWTHAHWHQPQ